MECSAGYIVYIVAVSPYMSKIVDNTIFYDEVEAKSKRDKLNSKYYGDERIKPWKVYSVICNVQKEEIK